MMASDEQRSRSVFARPDDDDDRRLMIKIMWPQEKGCPVAVFVAVAAAVRERKE